MKINFSFRYWVLGFYIDNTWKIIRIYPLPFIRISIGNEEIK